MLIPTSVFSFSSFVLKCIFGLNGNIAAVWREEEDSKGMKRETNEDKIITTGFDFIEPNNVTTAVYDCVLGELSWPHDRF